MSQTTNHSILEFAPDLTTLDSRMASGGSPQLIFREFLQESRTHLHASFDNGASVSDIIAAYTKLVDEILRRAWQLYIPTEANCALIAVGGYGRGELHPGSDIDILILLDKVASEDHKITEALTNLITFLFDLRFKLGHSVRTVAETIHWACKDITVITNLLEARFLSGAYSLYQEMQRATAPDQIWPSTVFFAAKWQEQKARWQRFGNTAYNLEPNIKENPGGLRDIHNIGWVCRRHFDTRTLYDLVQRNFLTDSEYRTLMDGQTFLWQIRYVLHHSADRCEDRLLFAYQLTLAEHFGYKDDGTNLAVEQFMQRYYRTVTELNRLNEMLMQLFQEAILLKNPVTEIIPINSRFQVRNGYLETTNEKVFEYYPYAMLEIFLLLQIYPNLEGVRASTIRQIRTNLWRIDAAMRQDIRARSLFMEILRKTDDQDMQLPRMNNYGVLAAYIPAFKDIVGRMQYDLFHVYTVDAHTLFVLRNLHRLTIPRYASEFPLASAIVQTIPKLELLYIAALFHDIAKGRGGDHSVLGAQEALIFCRHHSLSDYDSRLVSWLVNRHLLMSMTAQRKDTSDIAEIQAFAAQIGDLNRLDYLYLLTLADIRATNPARWNAWKDTLLKDLYHNTRQALQRGLDNPQAQEDILEQKRLEALRLLSLQNINPTKCKRLWKRLSNDFCLSNSPAEMAWQTRIMLETTEDQFPKVAIRPETERGCTQIFLYTTDKDGLFAWSTALLSQLGLNIMDARLITNHDNRVINLYLVLEQNGTTVTDIERQNAIISTLKQGLCYKEGPQPKLSWHIPYQNKFFATKTKIRFSQDIAKAKTLLRLVTMDRPGLLAEVGQVFGTCGIRLHNAKIATLGAEVEDIFFITNTENQPITDTEKLECLRQQILQQLNIKHE